MKNNLLSFVIIIGIITINAGMLSRYGCEASHDEKQFSSRTPALVSELLGANYSGYEELAARRSHCQDNGSAIKGRCAMEWYGIHFGLHSNEAAIDLKPKGHTYSGGMPAAFKFTSLPPALQYRPPKQLA